MSQNILNNPKSDIQTVIVPADGTRFISGVAHHYKDKFPKELEPYIEFDDYQRVISDINDILRMFWPCFAAMCIGYFFCPITLGLSLLIPNNCVSDAEREIRKVIETANREVFGIKGINMQFRKGWFTSWIEITIPTGSIEMQKPLNQKQDTEIDRV